MKILEIMTCVLPSQGYGVARYSAGLSRALAELGHEVHVLSVGGPEGIEEERHGVRFHHLETGYSFYAYNDHLQSVLENLPLSMGLTHLWERQGPFDVVLAHDWTSGLAASTAQRVFQAKLISVLHGCQVGRSDGKGSREELFAADMERWLCERSDHVVVESEGVREELERHYQVSGDKISLIPGCIDARVFEAEVDREEFRAVFAKPEESIVLFAGRLVPAKGPDLFVEAAALILKERRGAQCVIAGHGPMREALAQRVQELGIAPQVRFTGHLGPLVLGALYQVADVLLAPSRYESLGISVLEASLHRLPVVGAQGAGLSELSRALRKNQLELAPADPRSLARAVLGVLNKDDRSDERSPDPGRVPLKYRCERGARSVVEIVERLFASAPGMPA